MLLLVCCLSNTQHKKANNQSVRSSAPVVSRCFPGGYNVKLYISRGRLAWWLLAFFHSDNIYYVIHFGFSALAHRSLHQAPHPFIKRRTETTKGEQALVNGICNNRPDMPSPQSLPANITPTDIWCIAQGRRFGIRPKTSIYSQTIRLTNGTIKTEGDKDVIEEMWSFCEVCQSCRQPYTPRQLENLAAMERIRRSAKIPIVTSSKPVTYHSTGSFSVQNGALNDGQHLQCGPQSLLAHNQCSRRQIPEPVQSKHMKPAKPASLDVYLPKLEENTAVHSDE